MVVHLWDSKNHKETLTSPFKIKEKTINENIKKISNKKIINFYNLRNNGKLYGTYVPVNTMKKISISFSNC